MKRMQKILLSMVAFGVLAGAASAAAGNDCTMVQDKKTGDWKYCCQGRCIWV